MRERGGSFDEIFFSNVHIMGDPVSKTVLKARPENECRGDTSN
jgi:hypothetical protein